MKLLAFIFEQPSYRHKNFIPIFQYSCLHYLILTLRSVFFINFKSLKTVEEAFKFLQSPFPLGFNDPWSGVVLDFIDS